MGILIRGMEIPKNCAECWLMDGENSWCCACRGRHLYPEYRYGIKDKPEWCPLVEIPPHGRLIDVNAIGVTAIDITDLPVGECLMVYLKEDIDNAPTIIEAEERET